MKVFLVLLLLLAACTTVEPMPSDRVDHGTVPVTEPNLPPATGTYEVTGKDVVYYKDVHGYLAEPTTPGNYPGVVMIHEWWGLNDNIKAMARQLASEGYTVLAVDLFGKAATTPQEAQQLTGAFNQAEGLKNMEVAVAYLRDHGAEKIGSLGWCFGGGQSLQLGLNENLDATVMYYGKVVTDESQLAALEQPVLGIFGAEDQGIPVSSVEEFDAALDDAGVENEINIYPGVGHAFANPSGDNYAKDAAEDAWVKTTAFLAENLE